MAETFTPLAVNTFVNDTTAVNIVNTNFNAIATIFNDVLSRSGNSPNQMLSTLDMNGSQIINLPSPGSINSPARLVDVASNPTITVPPTGTSGATVPFLNGTNIWSGLQTFTPSSSTGQALLTQSTGTGSTSVVGFSYSSFNVNDNIASSSNATIDGLGVFMGLNGSAVNSARQGFQSTLQLLAPTSPTNPARFYVSAMLLAEALSNDGGTGGNEKGAIFGSNPVVFLGSTATHMAEATGEEVNTECTTGSSVLDKYGVKIVQEAGDTVAGSRNDAAITLNNQAGAVNWGTLIQVWDGLNQFPLTSSGTIFNIKGSPKPTFANGFNISNATITGNAFSSPGFNVTGAGVLSLGAASGTTGTLNFLGSTSGTYTVSVNSIGNTLSFGNNVSVAGQLVGLGGVISSTVYITQTPATFAGTSGTMTTANPSARINSSGAFTMTLPSASANPGAWLYIINTVANAVTSASSNVVPANSTTAGTALISATAGRFVFLCSDGTNWNVMATGN